MYSEGYRPRGEGKHLNAFRFLEEALPHSRKETIDFLQRLRRKRNKAVYEIRGIISEREMQAIIDFVEEFFEDMVGFMPDTYRRALGGKKE